MSVSIQKKSKRKSSA